MKIPKWLLTFGKILLCILLFTPTVICLACAGAGFIWIQIWGVISKTDELEPL